MDFDPGEDYLYFELPVPKEQLLSLITALRADPDSVVEVGTYLLSFTYEVDDVFREYYYPRGIILNEPAPCFFFIGQV